MVVGWFEIIRRYITHEMVSPLHERCNVAAVAATARHRNRHAYLALALALHLLSIFESSSGNTHRETEASISNGLWCMYVGISIYILMYRILRWNAFCASKYSMMTKATKCIARDGCRQILPRFFYARLTLICTSIFSQTHMCLSFSAPDVIKIIIILYNGSFTIYLFRWILFLDWETQTTSFFLNYKL